MVTCEECGDNDTFGVTEYFNRSDGITLCDAGDGIWLRDDASGHCFCPSCGPKALPAPDGASVKWNMTICH